MATGEVFDRLWMFLVGRADKLEKEICFRVIPWLAVMVTCSGCAASGVPDEVYAAEITTDRKEHSALDSTACLTEPKSAAKGYSIFRLLKPWLISPLVLGASVSRSISIADCTILTMINSILRESSEFTPRTAPFPSYPNSSQLWPFRS